MIELQTLAVDRIYYFCLAHSFLSRTFWISNCESQRNEINSGIQR